MRPSGDPRQGGGVCGRGGGGEVVGRGQRGRRAAGGRAHKDRPWALRQVAGRREEKVGDIQRQADFNFKFICGSILNRSLVQGGPSGRGTPPVDLVLALLAAGGLLL